MTHTENSPPYMSTLLHETPTSEDVGDRSLCPDQTWTRIGSIHALDWIGLGGMTVTPFSVSNHCSRVDAVYFK